MGIVTVFEWDMFFPDLLDIFVLTTLPISYEDFSWPALPPSPSLSWAFCSTPTCLRPLILPASFDPPNLPRLLMRPHVLRCLARTVLCGLHPGAAGRAACRPRRAIVSPILAWPARALDFRSADAAVAVPSALQRGPGLSQIKARLCSTVHPFWFLGIYQRLLEGPSALPIYTRLAQTGCVALLITAASWPRSPIRWPTCAEVRQLVVGPGTHDTRSWVARPLHVAPPRHAASVGPCAGPSSTSSARPCFASSAIASILFSTAASASRSLSPASFA
jgi:hypothetical protein